MARFKNEEQRMEADEVLMQAKAEGDLPHGWIVFPLLRSKLIWAIAGWMVGILLGFGLLVMLAIATIPDNYISGVVPAIFTTLLLVLMLFIGVGSAWSLLKDAQRLRQLDRHMIVLTPQEFVKQEGEHVIHVPLLYVRHVTARGAAPPSEDRGERHMHSVGDNYVSFFAGRGFTASGMRFRRKRMRTPTSLAFVDGRTDQEVTVVTDSTYGDPFMIAALLKQYVASVQCMG